jgi:DNA invertase Pin-like site-specific DNA recombinase
MSNKKENRVVGYERLSSAAQAFHSPAREQQKTRLLKAGATEIIEDIESGRNDKRPGLQRLMTLVANQEVDEVIITKLDRLGRSVPKIRECISIFKLANVNLRILDQDIDLSTPHGMLMLNILGAVAEMESDLVSDRVRHGKQHRKNKQAACEAYPWAYIVVDDKYQLDNQPFLCLLEDRPENSLSFSSLENSQTKENSQRVKEIEDIQVVPGRSPKQLAEETLAVFFEKRSITGTLKFLYEKYGISKTNAKTSGHSRVFYWSKSGLTRWLRNPVLSGHTVYNKSTARGKNRKQNSPENWTIIYNTHPNEKLLDDEQAEEIRYILEANKKLVGENFNRALGDSSRQEYSYQTGLIYCAECGSRCTSKTSTSKGKTYSYFACRHSGIGCCNSRAVEKQKIEDALIKYLVQQSRIGRQNSERAEKFGSLKSDRLQELELQLQAAESFPGFNPKNEELKKELRQQIEEEMNSLSSLGNKTVKEIILMGSNLNFWYTLSNEDKVAVYHRLIHKIFLRDGEVSSILLNN